MTKDEFRNVRRLLDLTQAQLAEQLGCSKRQVESYDRGEKTVPRMVELAITTLSRCPCGRTWADCRT